MLRRLNSALALLLENMKHINCVGKPNRVNGPKRIATVVFDDLQDTGTLKTLQRLRRGMLLTVLGE